MATRTAVAARNASLSAMNTRLSSGIIRIYTGSQVASPETAVSGTLLAELTLGASAGTVASGIWTANTIIQDTGAAASGTPGWFRQYQSDGATVEHDGSAGIAGSGAELILSSATVTSGATVSGISYTYILPM